MDAEFLVDPETALLEIVLLLANLFLGTVTLACQLLRTSHIPEQKFLYSMSMK